MDQILKLFVGDYPKNVQPLQQLTDVEAMKLALSEAWRGAWRASPNPQVGCVILSSKGQFLAKGFHEIAGGPHAEISALAQFFEIGKFQRKGDLWDFGVLPVERLSGARVFVTLEPCAHVGLTPSCASTLASLPISEVIYGLKDPNPKVAGRGREILERAGKRCRTFAELTEEVSLAREFMEVCEHFLVSTVEKRPFVTLKVASSLDGVFGLKSGESQWITGEKARNLAHFFRGSHDAILVGRTTVSKDNPSLTIRHPSFQGPSDKKVVVIDPKGTLLGREDLNLFRLHAGGNLIWVVDKEYAGKPKVPVQLLRMQAEDGNISLPILHRHLWDLGIRSLLVEAGGKTLSAHLRARAADRLLLFQAPLILGAEKGRIWSEGYGVDRLSQGLRLRHARRQSVGDDILITGRIDFNE